MNAAGHEVIVHKEEFLENIILMRGDSPPLFMLPSLREKCISSFVKVNNNATTIYIVVTAFPFYIFLRNNCKKKRSYNPL